MIFDTEAYRGEFRDGVEMQTLRVGVCRFMLLDKEHRLEESEFYTVETGEALAGYVEMLARKGKTLYVYAHNIKYDLQLSGLLNILLGRNWKLTLFVIDDPPTFIRLRRGKTSILFVDTFNYWQTSVEKMGEQLGLQKLPMPSELADKEAWVTYCKRDVEVLSNYLLEFMRFLSDNDLAGLGLTLASQAFRTFRHRFMRLPIKLHLDERATQLERDAYTGGRVEAFWVGERNGEPYTKLDVNSMYPYVMKTKPYPLKLVSYSENLPVEKLPYKMSRYYLIADCEIETIEPVYPYRSNHKLIFPTGRFRTVLHQAEIEIALSHGSIKKVYRASAYEPGDIFSDYIDYFYGLKIKAEGSGDRITRHQAKILMNSLYGKFGQRETVSKIMDNPAEPKFTRLTGYSETLHQRVEVNYMGSQIEIRYKGGEATYSFPAIAGAVTAYARVYLWELMIIAGLEHAFYVDTDSLIVDDDGLRNLTPYLDPNRLGALKVEGVSDTVIIRGAKDYVFGSEVKHKGLPKSAQQLSDNLWEYDQFRGAKTWIKEGLPVGAKVYRRTKQRKTEYNKGSVLPSGKVVPLLLDRG